ncbi:MAG: Asp-tRNA(Asn)/Glu-tRNA(Gln) amidotransferase subunit GatC, partial [Verrucomicrobiae bacterium]|nr:Asp-tRNA(Asn)/Glu-tRNA(Gln) amidotransferase subunit GatC [Verrucomicrobiae bacterium]
MPENTGSIDVRYVSNLARVALTAEEEKRLASQLGSVLSYVDQLSKLNVSGIEPTAHANVQVNVFRKDESRPSLPVAEAVANAPQKANDLFI